MHGSGCVFGCGGICVSLRGWWGARVKRKSDLRITQPLLDVLSHTEDQSAYHSAQKKTTQSKLDGFIFYKVCKSFGNEVSTSASPFSLMKTLSSIRMPVSPGI